LKRERETETKRLIIRESAEMKGGGRRLRENLSWLAFETQIMTQ
jgi:hypothetical protein